MPPPYLTPLVSMPGGFRDHVRHSEIENRQLGERKRQQVLGKTRGLKPAPPGPTQERQADRDGQKEGEDKDRLSDVEEEDVLPVTHMRGGDAEAGCGERSRSQDTQRHPLGERPELLEDDVVPCALPVDRDERERRAATQPDDDACDVKRHEQAVASHLPLLSLSWVAPLSAGGLQRGSRSSRALESAKEPAEWPVVVPIRIER